MKLLWYYFVKFYMRVGFAFYFKSIRIKGDKKIPSKKPILFVANHQNALIDPLLIGATNKRQLYFLTQAQVFLGPFIRALFASVNMLPIYRIRDGYQTLSKNQDVFEKCTKILNKNQTLLIFPEGSHNIKRRIRNLSRGFTRIVFGALDENPDKDIYIIPIGFNYSAPKLYGSSVSIYYGDPISSKNILERFPKVEAANELKRKVTEQLKILTTHIEDLSSYDDIVVNFAPQEFLYPDEVNRHLKNLNKHKSADLKKKSSFNFLYFLVKLNSLIPYLLWKIIYPKIVEEEYVATFKFSTAITIFPLFYTLQALIVSKYYNFSAGLIYFVVSVLAVYILTKTRNN